MKFKYSPEAQTLIGDYKDRGLMTLQEFYQQGGDLNTISSVRFVFPENIEHNIKGTVAQCGLVGDIKQLWATNPIGEEFDDDFIIEGARNRILGLKGVQIITLRSTRTQPFAVIGESTFIQHASANDNGGLSIATNSSRQSVSTALESSTVLS